MPRSDEPLPTSRSMPLPAGSRRAFLGALALAPVAPASHAARRLAGDPGHADEADDMAAAGRLAGLQFTAAECQQGGKELARRRDEYAALRAVPVPFELPPCTTFDPLPPGAAPPATDGRFAWRTPAAAPAPPADDAAIAFATVAELAAWLRHGHVTSRRLTELALQRLRRHDAALHCVITLLADEALATADERDRELAAGTDRGPLHGIPYGAKDLFAWPSAPTTFGAAPWREAVWPVRAAVLERLHDAGAVLVAKLALGALAMGDLWFGGRTRTPWNPERGSSGSSAGSASAVAAGLVPFALGTETLGSIVSPCRACGVGGLRPTFGAVSRFGAMPLSWTMDKVGPIARSALDLALVFEAIRGADARDPSKRDAAFAPRLDAPVAGLRVGVLDEAILARTPGFATFVDWLRAQGVATKPVQLPEAPYRAMLLMLHTEAAAAFDDLLRDGRLGELPGQDDGDWPNAFRAARCVPAVEVVRASRVRQRLLADLDRTFAPFDVVVAPTHGGAALTATNLSGHPTLVLPVGTDDRVNGRPTVLALLGRLHGEAALVQLAAAFQHDTDWHRRRPPGFAP